jgi:hypothetical protein
MFFLTLNDFLLHWLTKFRPRYSGLASTYPEPADKEAFIKAQLYDFTYDDKSALPDVYEWPQLSKYWIQRTLEET